VYGVNSGRHQIIYNTSMHGLALFGEKGSGDGQLLYPKGIAANEKGDVYVADSGNNRIVRLFNPKKTLLWVAALKPGDGDAMNGPLRVAIDEKGGVYATDAVNKKIFVFNKKNEFAYTIPQKGSPDIFTGKMYALAIADGMARWSHFRDERSIFCADQNGTRLWKLGLDGKVIKSVQMPDGYQAFYGAIDYYHNYWVTDIKKSSLVKFDHNLTMLEIFGKYGEKDNEFIEPRGITIYKRFGQTFIAEKKGAQYYWTGTKYSGASLKFVNPSRYDLTVNSTEYSFVSLLSTSGKDTIYYFKRRMIVPPVDEITITDTTGFGKSPEFIIKMEPTYSSFTYNAWFYPLTITK
jgi:NHL repeat